MDKIKATIIAAKRTLGGKHFNVSIEQQIMKLAQELYDNAKAEEKRKREEREFENKTYSWEKDKLEDKDVTARFEKDNIVPLENEDVDEVDD